MSTSALDAKQSPPQSQLMRHRKNLLYFFVGVWFLFTTIGAEWGMLRALFNSLVFLGVLTLVASPTRTISLRVLLVLFLCGIYSSCLSTAAFVLISHIGIDYDSFLRPLAVAVIDTVFMLAPLVFWLWRSSPDVYRRGATDLMLMAAWCGAGYGITANAGVSHFVPNLSWLDYLPVCGIQHTPRDGSWLVNGHALLAAIAGASFGFASFALNKPQKAYVIASVGAAIVIFDRFTLGVRSHNWDAFFALFLSTVTMSGWLSVGLFVAAVVAVIAMDMKTLLLQPKLSFPKDLSAKQKSMLSAYSRCVGFAANRYKTANPSKRKTISTVILATLGARAAQIQTEPKIQETQTST